jgi:hypothetical protein
MDAQERYNQFLNDTWKQFSPKVRVKLEQILAECGNWAAELATEALLLQEQEYKQLQRSQEGK